MVMLMRITLLLPLLLALPALAESEPTNPFSAMFAPPTPAPLPKPAPQPAESVQPKAQEFTTTHNPETGETTTMPGRPANWPDGPVRKPPPPFKDSPEPAPTPAPSPPTLTFEAPGIYLLRVTVGKATGAAIVQVPEAGTFPVVVEATRR
jgi:hypothetical protein